MSSRSSLPKKFFHANNYKKAWKMFKTKLNISTTLKRTKKYCSSAFTFLRRKLQYSSRRDSSLKSHHFQYYNSRRKNKGKASFSAIYIDELFPGQNRDSVNYCKEKSEKPLNGSGNSIIETGETSGGGGDSYGRKVSSMFRGVDERAEEFITKIREEMKLEREKSIIDFQEMLARSS